MLPLLLGFVLVVMMMGEGCCPPNAWEGFESAIGGWVKDGVPHSFKWFVTYHTNITLGMVESEGEVVIDRWLTQKIRIIRDSNKGKVLFFQKRAGHYHYLYIYENATLVLNTYLGAGPETLAVKVYRFMHGYTEVYSTVTSSGCIPVEHVTTGTDPVRKAEFMEVEQRSGITVGVKDPSVFYIPSICHSADVSSDYVTIMSRWMPSGFY